MQRLRAAHLYLGCIFAPMLLFFALSGVWRTLGWNSSFPIQMLSSIHTGHRWKDGSGLSSLPLKLFVLLMALSFISTTILGIVMALKYGRSRRTAFYCLAIGFLVPVMIVVAGLL